MQTRSRISIAAGWVLSIVFLSPCISRACSIVYSSVQVGTQFRVRITDRSRPVRALRLVLSSPNSSNAEHVVTIYSVTDAEGVAGFSNVPPGKFFLSADNDLSSFPDDTGVEVAPNGPANVIVELKWPNSTPVSVRSASGVMRGPDYYPSQVQGKLSISLLESRSARVVSTTVTDSKGRFSFTGETPPGLYFVRVNPSGIRGWSGEQIEGVIAIEVDPNAKQETADLDLGWSSCGLGYAQRAQSEYAEIQVSKLCGNVTDSLGAVISNAQIRLLESAEETQILEQTKSGTMGEFELNKHENGSYKLLATSPGFRPFLRPLRFEAIGTPDDACQQPIRVKLDVIP
jgi:hypothetical protein